MLTFFKCIAEAIVEKGLGGLVKTVPGGEYVCEVAAGAWKKYRGRKNDAEVRAEIQELAQANFEEARKAAVEAVKATVPPSAAAKDKLTLELYLSQVPGMVRQSLKRSDDVTGKTVPIEFVLKTAQDMLKLLPGRSPRFKPGDPIAGLPGWSLVRPLGTGGFGEVWLAQNQTNPAERGAVKFCHDARAAALQHEGKLISRVMASGAHPNIVRLLKANLESETPWLMYEYVPGGDLGDWIRALQSKPTEERVQQAIVALRQLCPAVAHFHQLMPAIVHRDLKPSNILVDPDSKRVKVTDFGIGAVGAKAALVEDAKGTTTAAGRLTSFLRGAHTPLYSSPQQRNGDAPDPRDDVHALGVIAYQLLTGQLTRAPGTDFGHDLRGLGVNAALIDLIGECVAQNPTRRPANAGELLRQVQAISFSTPAGTRSVTSPPPVGRSPIASGYVRCACCNQPIPVTADDVGLSVTCPRTRMLVQVRPADVRGGTTPAAKAPVSSPTSPHSPRPIPPRSPRPIPPRAVGGEPKVDVSPPRRHDPIPTRKKRHGQGATRMWLVGGLALVLLISLGVAAWKLNDRPGSVARLSDTASQPDPKAGPSGPVPSEGEPRPAPVVTPPSEPKPKADPLPPVRPVPVPVVMPPVVVVDPIPAPRPVPVPVVMPPAVVAVEPIPAPRDLVAELDTLVAASKDANAAIRRKAADGLTRFLTNRDELIRRKAVESLADLGADAEPATAALRDAVKDTDADVRKLARRALDKLDEVAASAKAAKTREAILEVAKDLKAKEPEKRIKALDKLAAYGADANVVGELVIDAMVDNVPGVQVAAADTLEKINPKVHPHVLTILKGTGKAAATQALGNLGSDAAITLPLLLHCQNNPQLWTVYTEFSQAGADLFPQIAKIAPKDKRFTAAVLAHIAAPYQRRLAGLGQLKVIDADTADKVKALTAALGDGDGKLAPQVIAALEDFGKDAAPAMTLLKQLKLSPDDATRNAAIKAMKAIE